MEQGQQALDVGIGFPGERPADKRQQFLVGAVLQRLRRRHARVAFVRGKLERGDGGGELAPQAVVDHHVFAFLRQRRHGFPADGVDAGIVLDDQDLVAAGDLHGAIVQRLQEAERGFVIRAKQFI